MIDLEVGFGPEGKHLHAMSPNLAKREIWSEKKCTLKCKLKTIAKSSNVISKLLNEVVLVVHEVFKRTTSVSVSRGVKLLGLSSESV